MTELEYLKPNQIDELGKLIYNIKEKLKIKNKLFIWIINKNKKNIQNFFLTDCSFYKEDIKLSDYEIQDLIDKKILKMLSKKDQKITLTIKGILIFDYGILNPETTVEKLISDFNQKFFEDVLKLGDESINSKEISIIITLLGICTFSDKYRLRLNESNQFYFKEAVDIAANFVKTLGLEYQDGEIDKFWQRDVKGEGPILGEMRRLNEIEPHTESICKRLKDGSIYLDIITNNRIDNTKLIYLLKRIFDKRSLTFPEKKELLNILDKVYFFQFKLFKDTPPFDILDVRKQIKMNIESNI